MAPRTKTIKAVFFDFMGTCLDWHAAVVSEFSPAIDGPTCSRLALEWRRQYFLDNHAHHEAGTQQDSIDVVLARTLSLVLAKCEHDSVDVSSVDQDCRRRLIQAWHRQRAWPEVSAAISALRDDLGCGVFVHANGTTRLQLDLVNSSGLSFDMLFSSQLLGLLKPAPAAYRKALELVGLEANEVALVAAHAYDLRSAAACGMRTVYIRRWTDDIDEDMAEIKEEFDAFLNDMSTLPGVIAGLD